MADIHNSASGQEAVRGGEESRQLIEQMSQAMQALSEEVFLLKQPRVKRGAAMKQPDGSWVLQTVEEATGEQKVSRAVRRGDGSWALEDQSGPSGMTN